MLGFYVWGALSLLCAVLTITQRNPIHCALFLVGALMSMAFIFLQFGAAYVAFVQIVVYAGGVLILYLFVVMLMDLSSGLYQEAFQRQWLVAVVVGAFFCGLIVIWAGDGITLGASGEYTPEAIAEMRGNTRSFGRELFTTFLYPFEIVSLVLIVAMIVSFFVC